jgi:hypothetical protein
MVELKVASPAGGRSATPTPRLLEQVDLRTGTTEHRRAGSARDPGTDNRDPALRN